MTKGNYWYSIHGSDQEGYSLMVYRYAKDKQEPDFDTIYPHWHRAEIYKTLAEVIQRIESL